MTADDLKGPFLIVGLGNPGRRFRKDRHNIGFMTIDEMAAKLGVNFSRVQSMALLTHGRIKEKKVFLAKPQTFMNRSGDSVAPLIRYYRVPMQRLIIIFDDLDLPLGTIRLRPKGSSGGHHGLESIIRRLGTEDFPRMRLGIGRPPGRMEPADFVLQAFSKEENELVEMTIARAVACASTFVADDIQSAMNRFNSERLQE